METSVLVSKLNQKEPVLLSLKGAKFWIVLGLVLLMSAFVFFVSQFFKEDFVPKNTLTLSAIFYFSVIALYLWVAFNAVELKIIGKELMVKPLFFKPEFKINVQQVQKVKSFSLKRTRYSMVWFTNNFSVEEKFLVLQSNSLIFGVQPTVKDVVELAKGV